VGNLIHDCRRLIALLTIVFGFFGIRSSAHGQQGLQPSGSLHVSQLHPSRFVYGTSAFAQPINPIAPMSTRVPSAAYTPGTPMVMTQSLTPGVSQSSAIGQYYDNSLAADQPYSFSAPLFYLAPAASQLQPREDLQRIISQSSAFSPRNSIQVLDAGPEVVLRGSVVSDYDRQLAQALLLLSPSVQAVRNELTVGQ